MDYEKYNNALEKARVRYNEIKDTNCSEEKFLLELFPELKESEDERIREEIIKFIKKRDRSGCDYDYDKWIAWLEKQKAMDKDIIFRPLAGTDIIVAAKQALEKIEIGKEVVLAFNGAYIPVNGKTVAEICNEYFSWVEKQGEQKVPINDFKAKNWYVSEVDGKIHDMTYNPADKVEPKFHEGDWIIDKQGIVHQIEKVIENVTNNTFGYDLVGGGYFNEEVKSYRLWTIADAKDGNVLYSLDSNQPFIYKERNGYEQATAYCGLNIYGKFFVWNTKDCIITTDKYIPATKEQHDTLLKAMADAGYTFDFEKKELKLLISNGGDFESNNSKQNPTWSEEDEEMIDKIIDYIKPMPIFFESTKGKSGKEYTKEFIKNAIKWLKSIKGRIQPQQKWTEEDENGFGETLWAINKARTIAENENDMGNLWYAENWLTSLKERLI